METLSPLRNMRTRLRAAGLRPTRQRLLLGQLLFGAGGSRHVTAEALHAEAVAAGLPVSLATVYNTLNQFTAAGLLRAVAVGAGRTWFDTNTEPHHHYVVAETGELVDIPAADLQLAGSPPVPDGMSLDGIDIVLRLRASPHAKPP